MRHLSDTLYERYNTGDDYAYSMYGTGWKAQTFTIGNTGTNEEHEITSVKLLVYRVLLPGTFTVSIRAVDGGGLPTGEDLTSGTTDGDTLTDDTGGEWREIAITPYTLSASTKYAIVMRATGGDSSNRVKGRVDSTTPTYTGGSYISSSNSGGDWAENTGIDFMFEEYGRVGGVEHTVELSETLSLSENIVPSLGINVPLTDTLSLSENLVKSLGINVDLDETFNLSEDLLTQSEFYVALSETLALSENLASDIGVYLADTLDLSEDVTTEITEAIVKILRKRYIAGLKPARIAKVGRIGL